MTQEAPSPSPYQLRELPRKEKRRRRRRAIWRTVRKFIPLIVLGIIIYFAITNVIFRYVMFYILQFIGQMLAMISLILVQFVALFWFLARSKTEIILPGDRDNTGITFDDYKGQPKLIELVRQWVTLLQDRERFTEMGGNFINGLLLFGPPGTGKTYLAKAMAGEADIAFISVEGSAFRAMFIGIDILKMMQFVNKAKRYAREYGACIAYIDEIDGVGASRGAVMTSSTAFNIALNLSDRMDLMMGGFGGGSGALTRLLVAMDGIEEKNRAEKIRAWWAKVRKKPVPKRNWHVLFMGATNRPDVLDPALTRPGRFDTLIGVDPPDATGRREIINYYLSKIGHDDTVDLEAIVNDTTGFTPAALSAMITKLAVRIAIFNGREKVNQSDIDRAMLEQTGGLENPILDMPEDQRRQIAYHEAGHAIGFHYLMPNRRLVRATIIRQGRSLGHVRAVNEYEEHARPLSEYVRQIMVSMAGQVATRIATGESWTGASGGDYPWIRQNIRALLAEGYFGPPITEPSRTVDQGMFEGKVFDILWDRIEIFWKDTERKVAEFLSDHRAELDAVAEGLLKHEFLSGNDLREIISQAAVVNQNGKHPMQDYVPMAEESLARIADLIIHEAQELPATEPLEE